MFKKLFEKPKKAMKVTALPMRPFMRRQPENPLEAGP